MYTRVKEIIRSKLLNKETTTMKKLLIMICAAAVIACAAAAATAVKHRLIRNTKNDGEGGSDGK